MRFSQANTPLLELLRALETDERRDEFAELAGTTRMYAYQLGTCQRRSCRTPLAVALAEASNRMNKKYGTPVISIEEIGTMCGVAE